MQEKNKTKCRITAQSALCNDVQMLHGTLFKNLALDSCTIGLSAVVSTGIL